MVPATHEKHLPVPRPADSRTHSAGSSGRIPAGSPAPSNAADPPGGATWTEEV